MLSQLSQLDQLLVLCFYYFLPYFELNFRALGIKYKMRKSYDSCDKQCSRKLALTLKSNAVL